MFPARMHRLVVLSIFALGSVLSFTGCGTPTSSVADQDSGRTLTTSGNTDWVLVHWRSANGEKQPLLSPAPTLHVGYRGRISGQAGVNDYVGTARIINDELNWGKSLAATRREGPPELIASEDRYLADLYATKQVTVRNDHLVFTGEKPLRLEFARANP